MASSPSHRIRRQRLLVRCSSTEEAFAIRSSLRGELGEALTDAIERAFDEVSIQERIIRIPRIEIDLVVDSLDHAMTTLPDLLYQQLLRQLRDRIDALHDSIDIDEPALQTDPVEAIRFESLVGYLQSGSLTWHARPNEVDATEVATTLRVVLEQEQRRIVEMIARGEADDRFIFRALALLDDEAEGVIFARSIAERSSTIDTKILAALIESLLDSRVSSISRHVRLRIASRILFIGTRMAEGSIVELVVRAHADSTSEERALLRSIAASLGIDIAARDVARHPDADPIVAPNAIEEGRRDDAAPTTRHPSPRVPKAGSNDVPQSDRVERRERTRHVPERDFPLLVENAGLVLLHPFLPMFLERRGVWEHGTTTIPEESIPRAAALLHMLATEREEIHEFELGMVAILLGLSPDDELPVADGLVDDEDGAEGEALLSSAITHWSTLKKTSTDGLRRSFLQRRGLLREEEIGWRLRVEGSPFDVLLDSLPWSISIIKLPWTTAPIHTEWRA